MAMNLVVQGLGFVGSAMAIACAMAKNQDGSLAFNVVGIDLPTEQGLSRIKAINAGTFPFKTTDQLLTQAAMQVHLAGNLTATTDEEVYRRANVIIVDIHLDVDQSSDGLAKVDFGGFKSAIHSFASRIPPHSLVIIETTVPPGTCKLVVAPILKECLLARGLDPESIMLAHSYERVMPGDHYLDSIRNFWRVYAGHTESASEACHQFLSKVIDTKNFPLTQLRSTTESELAKILENAYRAVNIAFVDEWSRLAEQIGVDMFNVVEAIRVRPTHNNIRQPGFGVGGYCLTKDPLLAEVAANQLFALPSLQFPLSRSAVLINREMPMETLKQVEAELGNLRGKKILLLGVTYRQDVGDTRHSPSTYFAVEALARGAMIRAFDPCAKSWPEIDIPLEVALPPAAEFDVIVMAVPHRQFRNMDFSQWMVGSGGMLFDANNVLDEETWDKIERAGVRIKGIGRGRFNSTKGLT
jgi:UDP-N-acetyl-D-glucosamine dehydrogenase